VLLVMSENKSACTILCDNRIQKIFSTEKERTAAPYGKLGRLSFLPPVWRQWPVGLGEVARIDAHERVAVIERGLVEDRNPLAPLLIVDVGPHVVIRTDLFPPGGQLHLREERVAVDYVAELEAGVDERLLDGAVVVALDFGRQDIALDELALASGFRLENRIGRIAGTQLGVEGMEHAAKQISFGVMGAGHERTSSELSLQNAV